MLDEIGHRIWTSWLTRSLFVPGNFCRWCDVHSEEALRQHLRRRPPLLSGNLQHYLDRFKGLVRDVATEDFGEVAFGVVEELELSLLCKPISLPPLVLFGCSQHFENLVDLVHFILAWEERPLHKHLSHAAAEGKYIRLEGVVVASENTFGSSVPSSTDIRGMWANLESEVLGSTEVYNLGLEGVLVDHNIIRLEISVHNPQLIMQKLYSLQNLAHYRLYLTHFVKFYETFSAFLLDVF